MAVFSPLLAGVGVEEAVAGLCRCPVACVLRGERQEWGAGGSSFLSPGSSRSGASGGSLWLFSPAHGQFSLGQFCGVLGTPSLTAPVLGFCKHPIPCVKSLPA